MEGGLENEGRGKMQDENEEENIEGGGRRRSRGCPLLVFMAFFE